MGFHIKYWDTIFFKVKHFYRLYCSYRSRMRPNQNQGNHQVSAEDWPWGYFPPFSISETILLSTDTLPKLLLAASVAPNIATLPQVYLTGVLPLVLGIITTNVGNFFMSGKKCKHTREKHFWNWICCQPWWYRVFHQSLWMT